MNDFISKLEYAGNFKIVALTCSMRKTTQNHYFFVLYNDASLDKKNHVICTDFDSTAMSPLPFMGKKNERIT